MGPLRSSLTLVREPLGPLQPTPCFDPRTNGTSLINPCLAVALMQADCTTPLASPRPVQQEAAVVDGVGYCAVLSSPSSYSGPYQLILAQDL